MFDLNGNLVRAKLMHGQWGAYFALLDEGGRITGQWFTPPSRATPAAPAPPTPPAPSATSRAATSAT
ncbi:hypothetical protein ACFQYP_50845 [Nonomuraea antimicrobica]